MANNSKLYEKMWAVINGPKELAEVEWKSWATSSNPEDNEACFLLAVQLRKIGRKEEAYKASELLSRSNPSVKSYNIYLVSTYDLTCMKKLSNDRLYEVFNEAFDFYREAGYEVNIAATLLKCCNYLISENLSNNDVFMEIYDTVSAEDKEKNSFIISQYYKRLLAERLVDDVLEHYEQLPPELKENKAILNIIKPLQKVSENESVQIKTNNFGTDKKITIISDQENAEKYSGILENFSLDATTVDMFSDSIIEKLNKATHKSTTAFIIVTDKTKEQAHFLDAFSFVLGFCSHKFGRSDVKVLQHGSATELNLSVLKNFEILKFDDDLGFLTLLGKLKLIGA